MYYINLEIGGTVYQIDTGDPYDTRMMHVINPQLEQEENTFGSLEFAVPPQHMYYSDISNSEAEIIVLRKKNDLDESAKEIFRGRLYTSKMDSYLQKELIFEGELSYLADSVQEPAEYKEVTPEYYVGQLLAVHNSKMPAKKQFQLGRVTVTDDDYADHITGRVNRGSYSTNYTDNTWSCLQTLVSTLGGHYEVRWEDGVRYLDYLKDHEHPSGQNIEFGENLVDYADEWTLGDLYTVIIPLGGSIDVETVNDAGETVKESQQLTIKDVNGGSPYIAASDMVINKYGRREKAVEFRGITDANHLYSIGSLYLNNTQFDNIVLSLTAVDMTHFGVDTDSLDFLATVHAISEPHGLNKDFPITKVSIPLKNPGAAVYTMSTNSKGVRSLSTAIMDLARDTDDKISDLAEDTEESIKKEVAKINTVLAGEPDDWIFGEPIIVYPKDEIVQEYLYHPQYMIKVYDTLGYKDPLTRSSTNIPEGRSHNPIIAWEEGLKENAADRLTFWHVLDYEDQYHDVSMSNERAIIDPYLYGFLPVNIPQPIDGAYVLYSLVYFPAGSRALMGYKTSTSDTLIGVNPETGNLATSNGTTYTDLTLDFYVAYDSSVHKIPVSASEQLVVIAQCVNVVEGTRKNAWYKTANLVVGTNIGVSVLNTNDSSGYGLLAHEKYGYNYGYNEYTDTFIPDTDQDKDHVIEIRRAVLCKSLTGQITTDEVYDNVRWLVGRFITGTIKDGQTLD